ncbi:MAG: ABC transporter substrate-binding protein [Eggerthellaceae bacterium]|nr:ABC transporter substrate-binding protein [Eggerthellaceae bacterium]
MVKRNGTMRTLVLSLTIALSIAFGAVFLAACGNNGDRPNEDTVEFTDSCNRVVTVPANITKVAVSGPLAQQILITFKPEVLVGLATEIDPEVDKYIEIDLSSLPVYGQIYGGKGTVNKEALAAAQPDVIIDLGEAKNTIVEDMDDLQQTLGIPCVHIECGLDSYGQAYTLLGTLLGERERASLMAAYCTNAYQSVANAMANVLPANRFRAAYVVNTAGLAVLAKGSYQAGVIDMVMNNVAVVDNPSSKGTGNAVDIEQLALWNPDLLIVGSAELLEEFSTNPAWRAIPAVVNGRYIFAPVEPYNWMGMPPSVAQLMGIQWLAHVFYPEKFSDTLKECVTGYYELFYQYQLSDAEYNTLMANSTR